MGCNCKNKLNPKYGSMPEEEEREKAWWEKVITAIGQLCFGIIASALLLVMLVPLFFYMTFQLCTGRTTIFKIPDITKWKKHK